MLTLCSCTPGAKRFQTTFADVFDTVTEFTAYCNSQEEFDKYASIIHNELLRCHSIFDIYSSESEVSRLNASSGEPFEASAELSEVISAAKSWYDDTDGQLNAAMGSVLAIWHDCSETGTLPRNEALLTAAGHCDMATVKADGNTIQLTDPLVQLNFGASAKGYAAQAAAESVITAGCKSFALSVGGNVITHGEKPTGKWEIGVEDPDGGVLTALIISEKAIVTSGDYQRYFEVDGVRYHHIIDPQTLYPAKKWRSVTVIADSSFEADCLSTALFCLPPEEGKRLLEKHGAEALWVSANGDITRSAGFSSYEG